MIMYIDNNRRKLEADIDEFVKVGGKNSQDQNR